ncbi:MAG: aldehyde dehydrogenase family protein, partial [Clostridia bacterium]|nr:aldehyde dehydrogenase family protein [Clostridia bacterium]
MTYDRERIRNIVEAQRSFFRSGKTLDVSWRREQLKKLKAAVLKYEPQLIQALKADLERSEAEGFFCDVGSTILEINEAIAGVRRWARPENHFSGFTCFPSIITKVYKMPYGTSLIISPFNFPVLLALGPLAASIAGGNTAVIKASSKSPACTKALQ